MDWSYGKDGPATRKIYKATVDGMRGKVEFGVQF